MCPGTSRARSTSPAATPAQRSTPDGSSDVRGIAVPCRRTVAGLRSADAGVPHHSWREVRFGCADDSVRYVPGRRSVAGTDASRARSAEDGRHGSSPREPADQLMDEVIVGRRRLIELPGVVPMFSSRPDQRVVVANDRRQRLERSAERWRLVSDASTEAGRRVRLSPRPGARFGWLRRGRADPRLSAAVSDLISPYQGEQLCLLPQPCQQSPTSH